eukprot:4743026-Pleurochrysis_carterae.AAC.1
MRAHAPRLNNTRSKELPHAHSHNKLTSNTCSDRCTLAAFDCANSKFGQKSKQANSTRIHGKQIRSEVTTSRLIRSHDMQ